MGVAQRSLWAGGRRERRRSWLGEGDERSVAATGLAPAARCVRLPAGRPSATVKVCVLQASYSDSAAEYATLDSRVSLSHLLPNDEVEHVFLDKASAVPRLRRAQADVYVNLCDGAWDEDTPGIEVVQALERLAWPFTGANARFYDPTREVMKRAATASGIDVPAGVFVHDARGLEEALDRLRLPCIVKPEHGYSSIGLTERSRVETAGQLHEQVAVTVARFGGALVEEFIEGREFSVLVASDPAGGREPLTYLPIEHRFEPGITFKTFDYKWKWPVPHVRLPCDDDELAGRLRRLSADVFRALGGNGYARADVRMDGDGRLFFLEINPNCGVFYPDDNGGTADDILLLDGIGKAGFLQQLLAFAFTRQRRLVRAYRVGWDRERGNALFAARDLAAGETIYQLEERPHVLVSRSHVERTWTAGDRELFRHYAYPITDEIYAIWDDDPAEWKPINHSCDPNAWVSGLDLCARRPIRAGEEITMDYATMYVEQPVDFACRCGTALCRGRWRGDDHRQGWFAERYGDHVTDYVRRQQREIRA